MTPPPIRLFLFPLLLLVWGCDPTLPPLRGQMEVGRDPYAVFVGGSGPNTDLYAIRPDGGQPTPVTFTNVAELRPALSPDGSGLAFLRGASLRDSTPATVWVMNLLTGSERELVLPKGAGRPARLGWDRAGTSLIVATGNGLYRVNTPPAPADPRPIGAREVVHAESALAVLLGDPVFAQVVQCERADDLCVTGEDGPALLARGARDPVRWGADSVAFFVGEDLEIRPLGRGRARRFVWSNPPSSPRQMTYFPGSRR